MLSSKDMKYSWGSCSEPNSKSTEKSKRDHEIKSFPQIQEQYDTYGQAMRRKMPEVIALCLDVDIISIIRMRHRIPKN